MIQIGARLHYAAPAALARAGMLRALVTDATSETPISGSVSLALRSVARSAFASLSARRVPDEIDRAHLHTYLLPSVQLAAVERLGPRIAKSAQWHYRLGIGGHWLARRAIARRFDGADQLYVHPCVSTDAIIEAKRCGLKVVLEAISHPFNKRIDFEEQRHYGAPADQNEKLIEANIGYFADEARAADIVLAASPYVRDGLIALGLPRKKIRIVRYGLDPRLSSMNCAEPIPGKVLYVGAINHLKGIPTLATAARLLASEPDMAFEAVGPLARGIAGRPEFEGPRYLGRVSRSEVMRHMMNADIFVFPTLSDGFGIVLLEAMAAGLPVISTQNCADLVIDGVNGRLIPDREPEALVEGVLSIVRNRELRDRMSTAARQTASRYGITEYSRALVEVMSGGGSPATATA